MKKFLILSSVLLLSLIFHSCSSDKPDNLPVSINATAEKTFTIIAAAGSVTSQNVTFTIDDFAALKDYKKYVESGLIQTSSYIEVKGITGDEELTNVKLSMNRDSKKNITLQDINSNKKYQELPQLTFLQFIIDEIATRDSSTIKLEYKANSNIKSPVTITIYLNSRFNL